MAFNPQTVNRGGEYLYRGLTGAGEAIAAGIQQGRQNDMDTDKLRKMAELLGYDKEQVNNMGRGEVAGLIEGDIMKYARDRQKQQEQMAINYFQLAQDKEAARQAQAEASLAENVRQFDVDRQRADRLLAENVRQFDAEQNMQNRSFEEGVRRFGIQQRNADREFNEGVRRFGVSQDMERKNYEANAALKEAQIKALLAKNAEMKTEISKLHQDADIWEKHGRPDIAEQARKRAANLAEGQNGLLQEIYGLGVMAGAKDGKSVEDAIKRFREAK